MSFTQDEARMELPLVSVIVLGWGGERFVEGCLRALLGQTYPRCEIILVDNGSPDRTAEVAEAHFPQVRMIRTGRNLGVAGGNNAGLGAARGDFLILTNVDTQAHPAWVECIVEAFRSDATIGVAGSKLLYPDGKVQYAGGEIDPVQGFARHAGWHSADTDAGGTPQDTDFATGAALAVRRTVLDRIGLEDEAYFPIDYEDGDLCYRARLAGWRVCYVPAAVSVHHESSTMQALAPARVISSHAGRLRFVSKFWSDTLLRQAFVERERDWLRTLGTDEDPVAQLQLRVLPALYLKMLLDLEDVVQWRATLGVSPPERSRATLTEVFGLLHDAAVPQDRFSRHSDGPGETTKAFQDMVQHWFPAERAVERQAVMLALETAAMQVNPHLPIAYPDWPAGVRPKITAFAQKVTRRLLRWYINPIVAQQNEVNEELVRALQALSQEVVSLRQQLRSKEPELGAEHEALGRPQRES